MQDWRAGRPGIRRSESCAYEAGGERGNGAERSDLLENVVRMIQLSLLLGIVLDGALCFPRGASLAPLTAADAPAQFDGAAESVSFTVSEQRACQALRVEADRQKLEALRAEAGSYVLGGGGSSRSSSRWQSCGGVYR